MNLDEMGALCAQVAELAKGVKRKGNPDYVLDPVSKRYKLKEPKAKKGREPKAAQRTIPPGWDQEKVDAVTGTLQELFPNPDSTVPVRVADPAFPRNHRTRLMWAATAHLVETTADGRQRLSQAGRDFMRGVAPPPAPESPAAPTAHEVASQVAEVIQAEGYRARVWASDIGHKVRVYVADDRGRDIGYIEMGAERPFGTLTKQSMNVQNALARSGKFGPTVPAVGIHEAGQHVERAISAVSLAPKPAPRFAEDDDVAAFRRDEQRMRRRERD